MAAQTATLIGSRHILGDFVFRNYTLGTVSSGDTLVLRQGRIESIVPLPTTAVTIGFTIAENTPVPDVATITFVTSGPFTGRIGVFSRLG